MCCPKCAKWMDKRCSGRTWRLKKDLYDFYVMKDLYDGRGTATRAIREWDANVEVWSYNNNNNNNNGYKIRFSVERRQRGPLSPRSNAERQTDC